MCSQECLELLGIEISEHKAIHLDDRHAALAAERDRPLPGGQVSAHVVGFKMPASLLQPCLGFLAPAAQGTAE